MPVDGGALGTVVVDAVGVADGLAVGEGEADWANATPKVTSPEIPKPAAAKATFLIILSPHFCLFSIFLLS